MSSEDYEIFRHLDDARKELRKLHAVPCPVCQNHLPKAHPKMLLPQERCNMHGYTDPRERIPREEVDGIFLRHGITRQTEGK